MDKATNKRSHMRFRPDPGTVAKIDLLVDKSPFKPTLFGLVAEESYRGCGLVLLATDELKVGDRVRVQVGKLDVMQAEVRWRATVDHTVLRVGLMYAE